MSFYDTGIILWSHPPYWVSGKEVCTDCRALLCWKVKWWQWMKGTTVGFRINCHWWNALIPSLPSELNSCPLNHHHLIISSCIKITTQECFPNMIFLFVVKIFHCVSLAALRRSHRWCIPLYCPTNRGSWDMLLSVLLLFKCWYFTPLK